MIATLLRVSWTNLKRDRVAQALTFLLPILFFSIFASGLRQPGARGDVARPHRRRGRGRQRVEPPHRRRAATRRRRSASALTAGCGGQGRAARSRRGGATGTERRRCRWRSILPKGTRRRSRGVRTGRQRAAHSAARRRLRSRGAADGERTAAEGLDDGGAGPDDAGRHAAVREVRRRADAGAAAAVDAWLPQLKPARRRDRPAAGDPGGQLRRRRRHRRRDAAGQVRQPRVVLRRRRRRDVPAVLRRRARAARCSTKWIRARWTACCRRASGMGGLLLGKWLFLALMGVLQLTVMFLWGRIAFGLDLFSHLPGFFVMTIVTAARRGRIRPDARDARAHARAAVGDVDDHHPHDVGARRQHVSALPDERDDAEVRAA